MAESSQGMRQEVSQKQALAQQQTLTPQMRQSLALLQAPSLELQQLVRQEIEQNPALEEESESLSLEEAGVEQAEDEKFEEEFEQLTQLDEEWREYMVQSRRLHQYSSEEEEKRQFLLDSLTATPTLQEYLFEQLGLSSTDEGLREQVEFLIGNLNEDGFLSASLEELCLSSRRPLGLLEKALRLLQGFDPVGVGSRDLQECLLIQLKRMGEGESFLTEVVRNYLPELAKKKFDLIARHLKISREEVVQLSETIATLNPHPGARFAQDHNYEIMPDVVVTADKEGEFRVELTKEHIPHLHISKAYKDMMAQSAKKPELRRFVRDKIQAGKFFIHAIEQRQQTIRRIAEVIVERQRDFLDHGTARLKPLIMNEVAKIVGVHETTVSRAIAGKYIATPQGIFDMKYFFTTGYQTDGGESVSKTGVQQALLECIKKEPGEKPYSDEKLAQLLSKKGITISRRTIAKYRKQLKILPSHLRKKK